MSHYRTYRVVDGERIEGKLRPVFLRNGDHYLANMGIYADGAIYCWEWTDLDGLRRKLDEGRIATNLPDGGRASIHELASWRFTEPQVWVTTEELLGEVADTIEELNGRPDSTHRCLDAALKYVGSRQEADRIALRAAYEEIPEHRRVYALGDMDYRDAPLRVLAAEIGEVCDTYTTYELEDADDAEMRDGCLVIGERERQWAFDYFAGWESERRESARFDEREETASPTIVLNFGRPMYPQSHGLRNEYPAPFTYGGAAYPTVEHAYWALSVGDAGLRERVRAADSTRAARELAEQEPVREEWPQIRLAVMADLLRAKFDQHPELAEVLLATGDGRLFYSFGPTRFWSSDREGRNWVGRLLELVRSELRVRRMAML
ncbi:NADAR family protein [Actinomadura hibisca]|uniref:NADAR family protein n=1 Tax=Actinomadura hibisca TaxID=68565 RepID=UPI00082A7E09|nr:NADAR family protein [Actinomadura hibisca]